MAEKSDKNFTLFGKETEFYGKLQFKDNLMIAGVFEGTIESEGNLEFAQTAVCKADTISAESIFIDGEVTGDIFANDQLEMHTGSKITGDVTAKRIRIEEGVDFSGKVTMLEQEPNIDIFSYSVNELKDVLLAQGKDFEEE